MTRLTITRETMSATDKPDQKHRNDMYGNAEARPADDHAEPPPIPAATVVLLRDTDQGPEVLMLRKTSKISFGGMWVFPGGRIDADDYPGDGDADTAARNAASREAQEEAGIVAQPTDFVWFSHWTPPPVTPKRFATWFFAARAGDSHDIEVDGGEIDDHAWIRPADALARHSAGEIDLVPPTWVTLYHLSRYQPVDAILAHLSASEPRVYETRVAKHASGVRVAMWRGDAGYEAWDANVDGARHRLVMGTGGFEFEHSEVGY